MSLEWREQMSVGNDLLDSDHKHFIEIINLAKQGMANGNRTELTTALDRLTKYSKAHFSREEQIAHAVGYVEITHLQESHAGLLENLERLKADIGEFWTDEAADNFSIFLRTWLINHVFKEDMLMKPYLKKFSPRFDPR